MDISTVRLMFQFLDTDTPMQPSHVDLLRQVRVFRDTDEVLVSRQGRTANMGLGGVIGGKLKMGKIGRL